MTFIEMVGTAILVIPMSIAYMVGILYVLTKVIEILKGMD